MNDKRLKQELKKVLKRVVIDTPEPPLNKEYVVTISADTIIDSQIEEIMNIFRAFKLNNNIRLIDDFIIFSEKNDLSFSRNLAPNSQFAERPYISLIRTGAMFKKILVAEVSAGAKK